jgi:hypothetical protein
VVNESNYIWANVTMSIHQKLHLSAVLCNRFHRHAQ